MNAKEIGGRIRVLREAHRLDQVEFASKMEVSRETVRLWEGGKSLTFENITLIASFFSTNYKEKDVEHYLLFNERRGKIRQSGIPANALRHHVNGLKQRLISLEALCGPAVPSHTVRKAGYSAKGKPKPHPIAEER